MAQPTYEYSGVCYTATSGQTTFALTSTAGNPIGYLSPSHIHVRTSANSGETWVSLPVDTAWNFADPATSIVLVTPATAGEWVDIQRKTPIDQDWIDFQAGSLLTAGQLNEAETFSLYCDQEIVDGVRDGQLSPIDPGVTKLIAGDNITLSPSSGVGEVTIQSIGGAEGVVYKGTIDATQTVPDVFTNGDLWINTVAGNAAAGWTGLDSQAIAIGERLIYDGTEWETLPMPPGSAVSSVNGQIGAVEIGVEQLTDFAYYPASEEFTFTGPYLGTDITNIPDANNWSISEYLIMFNCTANPQAEEALSTMAANDALDLTVIQRDSQGKDVETTISTVFLSMSYDYPGGVDNYKRALVSVQYRVFNLNIIPTSFLKLKSAGITNGSRPITTGETLIYDQITQKWRPQVPQVKVEELADFAYYPASEEFTFLGPCVENNSELEGTAYQTNIVGQELFFVFPKTNTNAYEVLSDLSNGDACVLCIYTAGGYVELNATVQGPPGNNGGTVPSWNLQFDGEIAESLLGDYSIKIKSAFIANGQAPITTGQALIYDQTTEKWRPEDIANGLNISALPALP